MESYKPERHILGKPIVYRIGIRGIRYLPVWLSYWFARRIADISYLIYKKARCNVKNNIRTVFPDLPPEDIINLAVNTFRNYSTYLVDYGRFGFIERDSISNVIETVEGKENLDDALKRGKGIILLTAHLGNWELGGIFFGRHGIAINVLTFRDGIEKIDNIRDEYRRRHNINTIVLGDSPFSSLEILNALNRNEIVAMLIDRHLAGTDGFSVRFFNKPVYFPAGPLILAKITGATILPGFVVKKDKSAYHAIVGTPVIVESSDVLEHQAQKIMEIFEKQIKRYPDQWYNFVEI